MYSKKIAIIVAGGTGQRMGSVVPKQFLNIEGKSILLHTIDQFVNAFEDIELVVVLPEGYIEEGKKLLLNKIKNKIQFIAGGDTRFQSVKNGLAMVQQKSIVFVQRIKLIVSILILFLMNVYLITIMKNGLTS